MTVTIKEILKKYPTNYVDINKMDESLLNHKVPDISIEDVEKPEVFKDSGEYTLLFRTKKNYLVTITQHSIAETWKNEYGHTHVFGIDDSGRIINT